MIVVMILNQHDLASRHEGGVMTWLAEQFGMDVAGRVDSDIASRLRDGLAAKSVSATVRVAGPGRIEIDVGGFKGVFFEGRVVREISESLRAQGVRAAVTTR
jgi:hypothetical protein